MERGAHSEDCRRDRVARGFQRGRWLFCQPRAVELPSGRRSGLCVRQPPAAEWGFARAHDRGGSGCGENPGEHAGRSILDQHRRFQFAQLRAHEL